MSEREEPVKVVRSSRARFARYRRYLLSRHKARKEDVAALDAKAAAEDAALPIAKVKSSKHERTSLVLFLAFLSQLAGHRLTLGLALAGSTVATLLALVPLSGTKIVIDHVLGDEPMPELMVGLGFPSEPRTLLWVVTLGMMGLSIFSLSIATLCRWHTTRVTKRVQVGVRRRAFDHAVRLPLHRVYAIKSGGVASILRDDAGAIAELIFGMIYNPWRAVVQLTGTLVILAVTDWRLLIGAALIFPVVILTHRTWIARIRPMYRDVRATRQHVDAHATEAFGGIRVVRGFSRARHEAATFVRNNHLMARQELHTWWWSRAVEIAWSVMIPMATAGVMIYGALRILDPADGFTTGDLVMFLAYLMWLLEPLAMLATNAAGFQNGLAALDRVLDLLEEPVEAGRDAESNDESDEGETGGGFLPEFVEGRVSLSHVHYQYPGNTRPVLTDINLEVEAGMMVALVGPSGAGKTTLSNLIARFFEPTAGRLFLDGRDTKTIDLELYRDLLGIVEQDVFLFDGTVEENIAYGRKHATRDQVVAAAKRANAHAFVTDFDKGYQTLVGERGVKLSGGQRQRLAIARAILADPRLLILDEATSNLDTESERLIQSSLGELMRGRTSFVIAHRLSTIAHADLIVVVEDGRITEQGTHEELLRRSGRYADMVAAQVAPPRGAKEGAVREGVWP